MKTMDENGYTVFAEALTWGGGGEAAGVWCSGEASRNTGDGTGAFMLPLMPLHIHWH